MAPIKHTARPTTAKEREQYAADGQKDFGWENPKLAALRKAVQRSTLRSKKAAKRDFARPPRNRKGQFVKKKKT